MSQRYQREIEEILEQVNEDEPSEESSKGRSRPRQQTSRRAAKTPRAGSPRFTFSSGKLMLIGVALLVAALISLSLPIPLAGPLTWLGIGLIIAAYVLYFTKPRLTSEKRWRGQPIEDGTEQSALQRFWNWLTHG